MTYSGTLRRASLVRTDVSEERSASIARVTKIEDLGINLVLTIKRSTLRINTANVVPSSLILVVLIMEEVRSSETSYLTRSDGVTSSNDAFFIVTAGKTLNVTKFISVDEILQHM
jgi:hypothetical protein